METKQLSELKEYALNKELKRTTPELFEKLKKDLTSKGQMHNLVVTIDGIVLGGNHRLRAMRDLGWTEAKCDIVEFRQEGDEWFVVKNSEEERGQMYSSQEQAMLDYSMKDNTQYSFYNQDAVVNYSNQYELPLQDIRVYYGEPINLDEKIEGNTTIEGTDEQEQEEKQKKYRIIVTAQNDVEQQEIYQKLVTLGYICKLS